jgi:hypothetical protein
MPKSGKRYSYKYQVKGKEYAATDGRERNINQAVGARFVVENDSLNPEVSTGHFALAVPDGILPPCPASGKHPPFAFPNCPPTSALPASSSA